MICYIELNVRWFLLLVVR